MLANEEYLYGQMLMFGRKTQERKMTDHIKNNKDIKEGEERLKEQEKKEKNRKYISFHL